MLSYQTWNWIKFGCYQFFIIKKFVSYYILHRSQPPNKYWPVPNALGGLYRNKNCILIGTTTEFRTFYSYKWYDYDVIYDYDVLSVIFRHAWFFRFLVSNEFYHHDRLLVYSCETTLLRLSSKIMPYHHIIQKCLLQRLDLKE